MTDYVDIIGRLELAAPHAATFSEKELLAEAAACIREMVEKIAMLEDELEVANIYTTPGAEA